MCFPCCSCSLGNWFPSVFPHPFSCLSAKIEKQARLQFFKVFSKPVELSKTGGKGRKKPAKQRKTKQTSGGSWENTSLNPTMTFYAKIASWRPTMTFSEWPPSLSAASFLAWIPAKHTGTGQGRAAGFQQGTCTSWGWKFGVNTPCRSEIFLPGRASSFPTIFFSGVKLAKPQDSAFYWLLWDVLRTEGELNQPVGSTELSFAEAPPS